MAELCKMTPNQIIKEIGTIGKHAATNIKLKSREIPKLRRCEMCLSYSDYTFPISMELCEKCYETLLRIREMVYTLSSSLDIFNFHCEMCGKKSVVKYEINPIVCRKCANRYLIHAHKLHKERTKQAIMRSINRSRV
ncbi:MAG: hypothetical protein ACOYWZ_00160 [Bacillota bacterium]